MLHDRRLCCKYGRGGSAVGPHARNCSATAVEGWRAAGGCLERTRLARECARLEPTHERALAEEGLLAEVPGWPEY